MADILARKRWWPRWRATNLTNGHEEHPAASRAVRTTALQLERKREPQRLTIKPGHHSFIEQTTIAIPRISGRFCLIIEMTDSPVVVERFFGGGLYGTRTVRTEQEYFSGT